jgi:phosphinothricin acetyltransferase
MSNIADFKRVVTLPSGLDVTLRILTPGDRNQLTQVYQCASDADLEFFRDDVRNADLVGKWAEHVNLEHVVPIVAVVQDRIVGEAMLQRGRGCDRHVAELRIYLCKDFRGQGLGNVIIKVLIDIARELDLHVLFVRIAMSQTKEIRAFQALGFKQEYVFKDRLINSVGDTQDVVEMALYLKRPQALL